MKNKIRILLFLAATAVMAGCFTNHLAAQGQGNFDPAQFRQRQLDGYRDRLEVKSDEDWTKIEALIGKVMDSQRDTRTGQGGSGFGGGRGGRGGGGGNTDPANTNTNRTRFGGTPSPEAEALRKAIDDKAAEDELKSKLAKVHEARKTKDAALEKAQADLRKALSPRQEAGAVLAGLLK